MPYAIIGILSLGLVISSIRTVVIERARVRKALVNMMIKRHEKYINRIRKHARRRQATVMGVSLMVMGGKADEIQTAALDPYTEMLHREDTARTQLEHAERWKEYYDLGFAFIAFLVFRARVTNEDFLVGRWGYLLQHRRLDLL
jgi:hypothetical protein